MAAQLQLIQGGLSKAAQAKLPKNSLARDERWQEELLRLQRRAEKIAALRRGEASIKKVTVEGTWVKRHFRHQHDRLLIQLTGRNSSSRNMKGKKK